MKLPLRITYHDIGPSPAVEKFVRSKAASLDRYCDRIMACRVSIDAPHRHHRQGKIYRVSVDLTVPGEELVAGREAAQDHAHEDVYVAIRDAFRAARRDLMDYMRRRRGQLKTHRAPAVARVSRLFRVQGYGFLETPEGRELYFHRNSVLRDFERIRVGTRVRFAEEAGDKGPQASTVELAPRPPRRRVA